jgi:hypothetical protein
VDWHFDQHDDGWTWRCSNSSGVVAATAQHFGSVADAEADAIMYGYLPGESYVGTIGRRPDAVAATPAHAKGAVVVRRRTHATWIWELRSEDGRVLDFSTTDFATRQECEAAVGKALTCPRISGPIATLERLPG